MPIILKGVVTHADAARAISDGRSGTYPCQKYVEKPTIEYLEQRGAIVTLPLTGEVRGM